MNSNRNPVQQWYIHTYNLPSKIYLLTLKVHLWAKTHPKFFTKLLNRKFSCINWSLQCACTIFCNIIEKLLLTTWLGAPCWTLSPIEHFRTEWPMFFNLLPNLFLDMICKVTQCFKLQTRTGISFGPSYNLRYLNRENCSVKDLCSIVSFILLPSFPGFAITWARWSWRRNIAKGTTDPRVEFILQDHGLQILNILQFQNLD